MSENIKIKYQERDLFRNIDFGAPFTQLTAEGDEILYIRLSEWATHTGDEDPSRVNAVNLVTGYLFDFGLDDLVRPVKLDVLVTGLR